MRKRRKNERGVVAGNGSSADSDEKHLQKSPASRNSAEAAARSEDRSAVGEAVSFPAKDNGRDATSVFCNSEKVYVTGKLYETIHVPPFVMSSAVETSLIAGLNL
jgi:hypothetical protein